MRPLLRVRGIVKAPWVAVDMLRVRLIGIIAEKTTLATWRSGKAVRFVV